MLIAGFAGAAVSCAEATGTTRAQVMTAATSIEIFMAVLPFRVELINVVEIGD
jgi:hypothetical protein